MSKIFQYEGDEVTVTYDVKRCIHAKECVHRLPAVFDPERRPWVDPDGAGGGRNKPFCDNSHLDIDFRTEAPR